MKPASEQAGAPAVPGWSGRLILNLSLFALAFMLGVVTLFVHVNTTSAFVRSFAEARTATVPLGLFFASATLTPFGLNVFMQRYGKKAAAPLAIGVGFAGAMTCFAAAGLRSLGLIVFGSMLQGVMFAYILSLRFVAASICPPSVRPRAMSFVIGAACVSGVIARELSIVGRDWLPVRFAGSYIILAIICGLALLSLAVADYTPVAPPAAAAGGGAAPAELTPMSQLVKRPQFYVAAVSTATTYTSMASLMAATPVRMLALGFPLSVGAEVVQYHVLAMYLPCLVTGDLIRLLGAPLIIFVGYGLMVLGILVYTWGVSYANYLMAMVLLGFGWNFCFLGSTALLTSSFTGKDTPRVQVVTDAFALGMLSVGITTASIIFEDASWEALVYIHLGVTCVGLLFVASYVAQLLAAKLAAKRAPAGADHPASSSNEMTQA